MASPEERLHHAALAGVPELFEKHGISRPRGKAIEDVVQSAH
ncbi:hypothetical protein [Streptomyces sp. NA02950]|nr:hypothetical protein [Streptomyces sp. NA02950]